MAWKCIKTSLSPNIPHQSGKAWNVITYIITAKWAWLDSNHICSRCVSAYPITIRIPPNNHTIFYFLKASLIFTFFFFLNFRSHVIGNSINNCLGSAGTPFQLCDLLPQQRDLALIRRHNVWEFWRCTELTANYRWLPVQSEGALEPSRELLDSEMCLLCLASSGTVTLF